MKHRYQLYYYNCGVWFKSCIQSMRDNAAAALNSSGLYVRAFKILDNDYYGECFPLSVVNVDSISRIV
jgi:hypothetical protein